MNAHDKSYIQIWAVLLVALFASLGLGAVSTSPVVIGVIFLIAGVKAWLVVAYFMHLAVEPRFLKLVMVGATAAVGCFFVGVYPDVGRHWSVVPLAQADADAPEGHAAPIVQAGDAARGAKVYGTYCVGCHAPDGKANGGTTGASFVDDRTRLAKSDAELVASIAGGLTGKVGTMPAWKGTLSQQQMVDTVAYLRASFGGAP